MVGTYNSDAGESHKRNNTTQQLCTLLLNTDYSQIIKNNTF